MQASFPSSKRKPGPADSGARSRASQQQPQPVQTPAVPQVQPLSSYIPSTPDQNVASFDQTTEHEVVSANDPGDLDIPDFLR